MKKNKTSFLILNSLTSILMILVLGLGSYMSLLPAGAVKFKLYVLHNIFGILTFIIALGYIVINVMRKNFFPKLKSDKRDLLIFSFNFFLYLLVILIPLTGIGMALTGSTSTIFSFDSKVSIFHFFQISHEILSYSLSFLVLLNSLVSVLRNFSFKNFSFVKSTILN